MIEIERDKVEEEEGDVVSEKGRGNKKCVELGKVKKEREDK